MVQRCVEFVEEMAKDQSLHEPYVALMECLRTNTDGKIYVENERARLTLRLALLKEKNGWYYSFRFFENTAIYRTLSNRGYRVLVKSYKSIFYVLK